MPSPAQLGSSTAESAQNIREQLADAWLPLIYQRILKMRTRSYQVGAAAKSVEIQHTLLGVELKLGRRRLLCPDLATARYLAVFARAGCTAVAIPYDISRISHLADELDSSWHRMLLMAGQIDAGGPGGSRLRRFLITQVRTEIMSAGAGAMMPSFKPTTKQRRA
jgi:hypothetical protein